MTWCTWHRTSRPADYETLYVSNTQYTINYMSYTTAFVTAVRSEVTRSVSQFSTTWPSLPGETLPSLRTLFLAPSCHRLGSSTFNLPGYRYVATLPRLANIFSNPVQNGVLSIQEPSTESGGPFYPSAPVKVCCPYFHHL